MDPIRRDDVEAMRVTPASEKARQAFDLMRTGIRLRRAALRSRHPDATDSEIDEMLRAWLETDE